VALISIGIAGCSAEPERFSGTQFRGAENGATSAPGPRLASASYRPPAPIPEAPATVAADTAPARGIDNRDRREHAVAMGRGPMHVITPGKTTIKTAVKTAVKISKRDDSALRQVAKTNNISLEAKPPKADQIVRSSQNSPLPPRKSGPVVAEQPPAPPIESVPAVPAPDNPVSTGTLKAAEAALKFDWPVRGQVVAGFGSKINGQQNHGIDVAVPEDTSIKAAESGVVVYSGNQLKTFGNLLLVRHPNGYVTVYAHAKELLVKAGDEIKRGQIIAKAGRTGDADRPELHFEIRKASTPVDPMPYLAGA
jgi:murein DD-endopeptidase MepM/ murein hydrolase activator NlpD